MAHIDPTVFVVDDDAGVRDSIALLIRSVGLKSQTYPSANDFLVSYVAGTPGCLVLDVRMPGMSGLELQERLEAIGSTLPIIFLTAHGDIPMAVQAVKAGAVDFIQKPFRDQALIDRIQQAIEQDKRAKEDLTERDRIADRQATLTPREREVMNLVVEGRANKAIAIDLGLSQRTVEIHRARVMKKMQAESLSQLVQMVMRSRT